jgi:hypothetical protein
MTRFLYNDQLWNSMQRCSHAKNVCAAVAFIGTGGADLLPLKGGDTLVVDLSLIAVKQGSTDPSTRLWRSSASKASKALIAESGARKSAI